VGRKSDFGEKGNRIIRRTERLKKCKGKKEKSVNQRIEKGE
jgi:hypothetical protein